jgi:hypothetical protein
MLDTSLLRNRAILCTLPSQIVCLSYSVKVTDINKNTSLLHNLYISRTLWNKLVCLSMQVKVTDNNKDQSLLRNLFSVYHKVS